MPRTINADGRTITVPDDATPEEINEIVGPATPATTKPVVKDWRDPLTELKPFDPSSVMSTLNTTVGNVGAGALGVVLRPVDTAKGVGKFLAHPLSSAAQFSRQFFDENGNPAPHALENAEGFLGQMAAFGAAGEAVPKLAKVPGRVVPKVGEVLRTKYAPREIPVGGGKVPATVGEAEPESPAGRTQLQLKRSGAAAPKFEKVERAQQEAVKGILKNTAQKASGFIGPMQEEAGGVLDDAATASFRQAEPLYNDLDTSLRTVPGSLEGVSRIVQDAIGKARKLGVNIDEAEGDISKIRPDKNGAIQWGGSKISKASHPERWAKLVNEGIIDDSGASTPLKTYRAVRSQLAAMQRSATSDAARFAIGHEIKAMDTNIDAALKGTPLEGKFIEANRLWRQGKARIEVANAVKAATKGTPASVQAPGLAKVPTEIQGANLVKRLNDLADDGTLEDAYTSDEIRNLRQSAEILDRIQSTPVGKGSGESMSLSRGLTHAVRGYKGPMIGGAVGGVAGVLSGHPWYGAEMGAGMGFVIQSIGERSLVNVMTKLDGVKALQAVANAKTPAQLKTAMTALSAAAVVGTSKKRPGDILPKTE